MLHPRHEVSLDIPCCANVLQRITAQKKETCSHPLRNGAPISQTIVACRLTSDASQGIHLTQTRLHQTLEFQMQAFAKGHTAGHRGAGETVCAA